MRRGILLAIATLAVVLFLVVGFLLPFDGAPAGQWGPFRGQVVDDQTGKPIPGAIFVAIWIRMIPAPGHAGEVFNDARVAVADAEGRFEIPRRWRPIFSGFIEPVYLSCVAPGYVPYRGGSSNQPRILRLRPLGAEDRKRGESDLSIYGMFPPDRMRKEFETFINSTRRELGLGPAHVSW